MDALKKMYAKLRFENIQTYVQSGNVVFSADYEDPRKLEKIISAAIETEFGLEVPVIVMDVKTLEAIIQNNPFAKEFQKDSAFLHVTFLAGAPDDFDKDRIIEKKHPDEEIAFTPQAVYLYCPNGYGKTKLHNTFLEKKLNVKATTRNWKTTHELLKICKN